MKFLKKEGKLPVNTRISIDYTSKKPKIKFSYPRKDVLEQTTASPLVLLTSFFLLIMICLVLYYSIQSFGEWKFNPTECNFSEGFQAGFIDNITINCDNGYSRTIEWQSGNFFDDSFWGGFSGIISEDAAGFIIDYNQGTLVLLVYCLIAISLAIGAILLFYWMTYPIARAMLHSKKFKENIPYINDKVSFNRGYYAKFTKVPSNRIIELPWFHNIKLNYRATKEFSKYLERVEIKEHPFSKIVKKGKKRKKQKQIYYWYSRFYFKEIPKTGYLEIAFK